MSVETCLNCSLGLTWGMGRDLGTAGMGVLLTGPDDKSVKIRYIFLYIVMRENSPGFHKLESRRWSENRPDFRLRREIFAGDARAGVLTGRVAVDKDFRNLTLPVSRRLVPDVVALTVRSKAQRPAPK